jgi:hypothetical protein
LFRARKKGPGHMPLGLAATQAAVTDDLPPE